MHSIIISSLFLLVSMLTYAADAPKTVASYAAEKAEVVISEDTLPKKVSFSIPTEGGEETHILKLKKIEAIELESFDKIIREYAQQGLPTPISLTTYLNGQQVSHGAYKAQNLIDTFEYQDDLRDPLTNCDVLRASVHLVDVSTAYNAPSSLQTIFLGDLPEHQSKVQALYRQIDELNQTNEDKEIKTIKFFIQAGKIYSFNESPKDTHSVYNATLALKFFQRALSTIENMPPNVSCNYKENNLRLHQMNCLRRCGNIFACFYVNDKKDDYARHALMYYDKATQLGDQTAEQKAYNFVERNVDITFLHKSGYGELYLNKLKSFVSQQPTSVNYWRLSRMHEKLGNTEEAKSCNNIAWSKHPVPPILRKYHSQAKKRKLN